MLIMCFVCLRYQVKVLKKPRFELAKLMEMHGDGGKGETVTADGVRVDRPDHYEPPVQAAV